MAKKRFRATTSLLGSKQVSCSAREQSFVMDRRRIADEVDTEPRIRMTPGELLLQALGSCLVLTAETFAEKDGFVLRSLSVDLTGEIDSDGGKGQPAIGLGLTRLIMSVQIEADHTDVEIQAFVARIMEACPIHATLVNPPSIEYDVTIA